MAKDKTNDMTVGNPVSLIIRFMIPRLHMKLTIACARITVSHRKFFFPMKEKLFTTNSTRISG